MNKNIIRGIAILAIILVVFSVIAFAVPFQMNGVFWLAYIFGVIAIAVQGYALYAGFVRGEQTKSRLYGFPIARIGTVYMVGQAALSLVLMALAVWVPVWLTVILCAAALAAAAVGMIAAEAVREEIEVQDAVLQQNVKTIRALQSKAQSLVGLCRDPETEKVLQEFSDALRYSDPVSSPALEASEAELTALTDDMQKALLEQDHSAVKQLCARAAAVLAERNRLCKLNK